MANGRVLITQSPAFTPRPYGLLSVAQDLSLGADPHWQGGITYEPLCPVSASTYDECLVVTGTGTVPEPPTKALTWGFQRRGATPFTVFAEVDCSPAGSWDDIEALAREALIRSEQFAVEATFWTGFAANQKVVYPHLAADVPLIQEGITLQTAAGIINAGTALDIVEGLGRLEDALGDCYHGVGVIHVPQVLIPLMDSAYLLKAEGGKLKTELGNLVVAGAGYRGSSPANLDQPGVAWMYVTGQAFYLRGDIFTTRPAESLDRSINTVKIIAERTYVVGWDCCHLAVPISTGGVVSGSVNVAT